MAQMLLSEARTFLQDELLRSGSTGASDSRADRAIQAAGNRFIQNSRITRRSAEVDMTAELSKIDLSADADYTHFRPERLIRAEIGYSDQGAWSTSTAYTLNQMVQGDGSPDARFYRCILAHTSSAGDEPGNTGDWETYWELLAWDQGVLLENTSIHTIARELNENTATSKPTTIAFQDNADTAYVYPAPDTVYTLRCYFWEPLLLKNASTAAIEAWVIGDSGDGAHELNIPEEYTHEMLIRGALPVLTMPDIGSAGYANAMEAFEAWSREIQGKAGNEGFGVFRMDPEDFI